MDSISKELDTAFSTVGFVYIKNHGIDQQVVGLASINIFNTCTLLQYIWPTWSIYNCIYDICPKIDRVFEFSNKFFNLTTEEKNQVQREIGKNDGYVGINQEM